MKKIMCILLLAVITLTSCKSNSHKEPGETNNSKTYTIEDFFPFKENTVMEYEGKGNEFAEMIVYNDYVSSDRMQIRIINPGTTVGQVIEKKNGELRLITSVGEFYYRDDLTKTINNSPEILIKEPIKKDTAWTLPDGRKRYISAIDVDVMIPYGKMKAIEIITEDNDSTVTEYYADNVGLIKRIFKSGDFTVETSLKAIGSSPVNQTFRIYYPDFDNSRTMYITKQVSLNTNDNIKDIFESCLKDSPDKKFIPPISRNTKINSLYLDTRDNCVHVDFSEELITEMNAGTSLESLIIQSLTNTFGSYYNTSKVYVTVAGKPYSSGHILLKENEFFTADYSNAPELK